MMRRGWAGIALLGIALALAIWRWPTGADRDTPHAAAIADAAATRRASRLFRAPPRNDRASRQGPLAAIARAARGEGTVRFASREQRAQEPDSWYEKRLMLYDMVEQLADDTRVDRRGRDTLLAILDAAQRDTARRQTDCLHRTNYDNGESAVPCLERETESVIDETLEQIRAKLGDHAADVSASQRVVLWTIMMSETDHIFERTDRIEPTPDH